MADSVLASWQENKELLTSSKELKPLLYAAWRALKTGVSSLFTHAFTSACFIVVIALKFLLYKNLLGSYALSMLFDTLGVGVFLLYFLIVCALRSSVSLKDSAYYFSKTLTHVFIYIFLAAIFKIISLKLKAFPLIYFLYSLNFGALLMLFLLFYLDGYPRNFFVALKQAAQFFCYNYPLVLLLQLSYLLLSLLLKQLIMYLFAGNPVVLLAIDLVLFTAYAALFSTLYIKRLYQQLKLYV